MRTNLQIKDTQQSKRTRGMSYKGATAEKRAMSMLAQCVGPVDSWALVDMDTGDIIARAPKAGSANIYGKGKSTW